MKKLVFYILMILPLVPVLSQDRYKLLSGAVGNELDDENWDDLRIGFGLRTTLAQVFYETGYFVLVEEKEEIKEKIASTLQRAWLNEDDIEDVEENLIDLAQVEADFVASANIIYFGRPRSRVSIGVLHRSSKTTKIKIEVFLKRLSDDEEWSAVGEGESEQTATSALLEINDRTEFDKSTLGIATRTALTNAVEEIMEEFLSDN